MARRVALGFGLSIGLGLAGAALAQGGSCRLALALGLDVSGSVNAEEYRLQRGGLAAALVHPDVVQVFLGHPGAHVRIAVYEWSGPSHQQLLVGWSAITDRAALDRVVATLLRPGDTAARQRDRSTALGSAMVTGAQLLAAQPRCWQRKLDISGDGKQNTGPHPRSVRAGLEAAGITINALVIGADNPRSGDMRMVEISELVAYFENLVLMGPGAFVEVALSFADYEAAMVRKLMREMEGPVLSSWQGAQGWRP